MESKTLFRLLNDEVKPSAKVRDDIGAMGLKFAALGFTIVSSKYVAKNIGLKTTLGKLAQHSVTLLVASSGVTNILENPDVFVPSRALTYLNTQYHTFGIQNSSAASVDINNNNNIFPQTRRGNSMDSWDIFSSLDQVRHAENVNTSIDEVNVLKREPSLSPKVDITPPKIKDFIVPFVK